MPTPSTLVNFLQELHKPIAAHHPQEILITGTAGSPITYALLLANHQFQNPVRIVDVVFNHFVDLAEAVFDKALRFERCTFKGGLRLRDLRVGGLFSLAGCTIDGACQGFVDARRLRVDGLCDLSLVTSNVGLDFTNLIAKDDLRLDGLHAMALVKKIADIPKNLDPADQRHLTEEMLGKALNLEGAEITKHVYVYAPLNADGNKRNATVTGMIDLRAKVGGSVVFSGATLTNSDGVAVNMAAADVGGSVFFREKTKVTGKIDLRAKVGGIVVFLGATLTNPGGVAVNMDAADVGGAVFFRAGTYIEGNVSATQAKLRNGIIASDDSGQKTFVLPECESPKNLTLLGTLDLSYAEITGRALFHLVDVWGKINARHLTVHGDLDFCGSIIGLSEDDRTFANSYRPDKNGELTPEQKQMTTKWQKLEINRGPLPKNLGSYPPLDFEMAEVHGRFWAKSTKLLGTITLEDAEIDGEANFDCAEVHGDLKLRSATIRGRVFADEKTEAAYPLVSGHVDLSYANVAQVDMRFDPKSNDMTPDTINLTGATVGTLRLCGKPQRKDGKLQRPWLLTEGLKFQQLELAALKDGSRPPESMNDHIRKFIWCLLHGIAFWLAWMNDSRLLACLASGYTLLVVVAFFMDRRRLRKANPHLGDLWKANPLLSLLTMTYPFSRGFYLAVEQWLRSKGDDVTANEAFHMRRRRESGEPQISWPIEVPEELPKETWEGPNTGLRIWYWLVDFAAGYGVRTGRLVHLYLLLFFINIGVFLSTNSIERPLAFTQAPMKHNAAQKDSDDEMANREAGKKKERKDEPYWLADGGKPLDGEWGIVNACFMAARVQVPFLAMLGENDWEPSSRTMFWKMTYEEYASLMMFVNLILLPLIIAGLSGFLKK